jgi:hypothetical protein
LPNILYAEVQLKGNGKESGKNGNHLSWRGRGKEQDGWKGKVDQLTWKNINPEPEYCSKAISRTLSKNK